MANASIDALYAGSLRLKYPISFLNYCTFNKWCLTKVAHCTRNNLLTYMSAKVVLTPLPPYIRMTIVYVNQ